MKTDGLKIFSATLARDRAVLGDRVTAWIADHPGLEVVATDVLQSSDAEFHCLTILCWFRWA